MARPRMVVVAGPPGGGKSVAFPISAMGIDSFNADDRSAEIHGSYQAIPPEVRARVNEELKDFIASHIRAGRSFAFETTFQNPIFFEQAEEARRAGFNVELIYIALKDLELHIERVTARARNGGHSAPRAVIENIYQKSIVNLPRALREAGAVVVLDNTREPEEILSAINGRVTYLHPDPPEWLKRALDGTEYDLNRLPQELQEQPDAGKE